MSPPVADKAPEILRSIKPWAAPAVNPIVRTTKRFLYLRNDACATKRFSAQATKERGIRHGGQMDVFQQPFLKKEVNLF